MKRFFIFVLFVLAGYVGFLKYTDAVPPFELPYLTSSASDTYQKFASSLTRSNFEGARSLAQGTAIDQIAEEEQIHQQIVRMGLAPLVLGMTFTKQSETRSHGNKRADLKIFQIVRVNPPGQNSAFGTPVPHMHIATLIKTDSGWKVESFHETANAQASSTKPEIDSSPLDQPEPSSSSTKPVASRLEIPEETPRSTPSRTPVAIPSPGASPGEKAAVVIPEAYRLKSEADLNSFRNAIAQFKEFQGRNPASLQELVDRELMQEIPEAPPGSKYLYHPEQGSVELASTTDANPTKTTIKTTLHSFGDMLNAVADTNAAADRKKLQVAVNVYFEQESQLPNSLDDLVAKGVIDHIPSPPAGKTFGYDPTTGKVTVLSK